MPRYRVVERRWIRLQPGNDNAGAGKACIEVRVSVGDVFACNARQPDDFLQSEQSIQIRFALSFGKAGIAVEVEHTAFGYDGRAFAVHFNATAFHHKTRLERMSSGLMGNESGYLRVPFVLLLVTPAVEIEAYGTELAGWPFDEYRPGISHPQIIDRLCQEVDRGAAQTLGDVVVLLTYQHLYRLM